ncbi:hypothetical protein M8009_00630 [Halomonas sp. ATCH28]|uniref:Transcriptional regulator n=1 Tax=Halomonas gemina TaxID=2945105 RepID=A0ABT0SW01_9GAMM|nr:hypothetical protein [Halomonas gemina]MCL7938808.1 hypothetical protein [Halomonas gemina]
MTADPGHQVLRALALQANREGSTPLDTIMNHVSGITWSDAEEALQRLQMLGQVRSLSMGHWFITREGLAELRRQTEALAREARDG